MKKRDKNTKRKAVSQAILDEEVTALQARLNFGHLPKSDMTELSRMIKLRRTGLRRL